MTALGFKSFADKTTLDFLPGITAIVGPNGCGKSNVSDAVRWVLGEQSPRAMRGSEMADVIFSGTEGQPGRKALGMAEVSLTISDVDQESLRAAGVDLSFNEVTITRRLFRDGTSEYFLNNTPCRLRDIQQLFMGTGVGRASYSIMAQGNITQIISSKPEDRRTVFEEAAGITKFKAQKREALRKLEASDQNLLRLDDLIREIKRQIGSLQRQAGKARRYKKLSTELLHLDTQYMRHQYDLLTSALQEAQQSANDARAKIDSENIQILNAESSLRTERERLIELEHQIGLSRQRSMEVRSEIGRHKNRVSFNEERQRELDQRKEESERNVVEADSRREELLSEIKQLEEQIAQIVVELSRCQSDLVDRKQIVLDIESSLTARQSELSSLRDSSLRLAGQLSTSRNSLSALEIHQQGNKIRLEKLSAEKAQLESERASLLQRLAEFCADLESEQKELNNRRMLLSKRHTELVGKESALEKLRGEKATAARNLAEINARLEILRALEVSRDGWDSGPQSLVKLSKGSARFIADQISVPAEHTCAIETALGVTLQLAVASDASTACEWISELSKAKTGRAQVAAYDLLAGRLAKPHEVAIDVGIPAASVVVAAPEVAAVVESLLARTRIVDDLAAATKAWQGAPGQFSFVTRNGEMLDQMGVYHGGQDGKPELSRILSRKSQIETMTKQSGKAKDEFVRLAELEVLLLAELNEMDALVATEQKDLSDKEVLLATRQGEQQALQSSLRILDQKTETVLYEVQSLAAQQSEAFTRMQVLVKVVEEGSSEEAGLQTRLGTAQQSIDDGREKRDLANTAYSETRIALAKEEQMLSTLRQHRAPLDARIKDYLQVSERGKQSLSEIELKRAQIIVENAESEDYIVCLDGDLSKVEAEAEGLLSEKNQFSVSHHERERQLQAQRNELTDLQNKKGQIEVSIAQKQMSQQNMIERVQQKYLLNLADIRSECITITMSEDGRTSAETVSPEEMAKNGLATDWTAIRAQVEAIQSQVDEMGPVNLVAIEECEEIEQRHEFLSAQHADLTGAKAQLIEVINRINIQSREMFLQTFEKIRDNFRTIFPEMFGGGKADLQLTNEGDVLECGIDIYARPPGKQLQSISLLSGGEQTMTAVALLFSIYLVKPSPFCVLDELDAPLDESNINRFVAKLKVFAEQSQFIVITHNKRTISSADVLYGVTMQERGVSRVVSVKFHRNDEGNGSRLLPESTVPTASWNSDAVQVEADRETTEVFMAK